jgi:hypothetical protein
VVCGPDGVAIFDALHRRGTVTEAMLYAFDLLELDGEDLRPLALAKQTGAHEARRARTLPSRLTDGDEPAISSKDWPGMKSPAV